MEEMEEKHVSGPGSNSSTKSSKTITNAASRHFSTPSAPHPSGRPFRAPQNRYVVVVVEGQGGILP